MTDQTRDDGAMAVAEQWDRTPWEPVRFEVGDRVRVRLSAECPYCDGATLPGEDGITGTVYKIHPPDEPDHTCEMSAMQHVYWVEFDHSLNDPRSPGSSILSHYCASELQPLPGEAR